MPRSDLRRRRHARTGLRERPAHRRAFPPKAHPAASAATISTRWYPDGRDVNLSHLLVGSEGTLAYFTAIELKLWPVVGERVLGILPFPDILSGDGRHPASGCSLDPLSVELVDFDDDRACRGRSRFFRPDHREGRPRHARSRAAGVSSTRATPAGTAKKLEALRAEDGRPRLRTGAWNGKGLGGGVVSVTGPATARARSAEVRKSGLKHHECR